eukprot:3504350-Lingulodinium_polyedra.AAC.1
MHYVAVRNGQKADGVPHSGRQAAPQGLPGHQLRGHHAVRAMHGRRHPLHGGRARGAQNAG